MGFPWKKTKSTARISQMVKDQFHHRKNAASPLVVETGFPTSLVDLIVNHRGRFKKASPSTRFNFEEIEMEEEITDPSFHGSERRKSMAEIITEDDERGELSESKRGKSRRAKIRSKMKKLLPHRSSRKAGKDSNPAREVEENEDGEAKEDLQLCEGTVEPALVSKPDLVEREEGCGCMILVIVALVGLVMGGRIYALVFTLTWSFLSRSIQASWRSRKVSSSIEQGRHECLGASV